MNIYCGRACSGVARRKGRSADEIREAKRQYDARRRVELADEIREAKRAYHLRTYDPEAARAVRAERKPQRLEYCRRPEYRAWKAKYDQRRLAEKQYGDFAAAVLVLRELQVEILSRATRYEIDYQNGKLNKSTRRKREYEKAFSS